MLVRSPLWKNCVRIALVAAVIACAPAARAADVGAPAPEIGVRDTRGAFISLAELRGSVAIVAFFESSLEASDDLIVGLERIHARHADEGLMVIAIATDSDAASFEEYVARRPVPFRVAHDPAWAALDRYAPRTIPCAFVLDAGGVIRHVQTDVGASGIHELDRAAELVVRSVAVPAPPPPLIPVPVDPGGPGAGWVVLGAVVGFFGTALVAGAVGVALCLVAHSHLGCIVSAGAVAGAGALFGSLIGGLVAYAAAMPEAPALAEPGLQLRVTF